MLLLASLHAYEMPATKAFAQTPPVCILPPLNLTNWWTGDFDARDVQGGTDGTLAGGARTSSDGLVDGSFEFNGVDGRVDIAAGELPNVSPIGEFSVVLWLKPSSRSVSGGPVIFQRERTYVGLAGGVVESKLGGQATSSGKSVVAGQWSHIALTYSNLQLNLYVDGSLLASSTRTLEDQAAHSTGIGYNSRSNSQFFSGQVDEVGFYDRALDATEVASIFNTGAEGQCKRVQSEPPSAVLSIVVSDIGSPVNEISDLASSLGGRMDRIYLLNRQDSREAEIVFSVPADKFQEVVNGLESLGEVTSRELRQGSLPSTSEVDSGDLLEAQIYVYFVTPDQERVANGKKGAVVIAVTSGMAAVVLLLGVLLYMAYRAGYRRGISVESAD